MTNISQNTACGT